jgi:adenylyltransferase/sulfurtransferase
MLQLVHETKYDTLARSDTWPITAVRTAQALIVGGGALGNEVCKNLALLGIKLIVILDRDEVELSNLTRSIFFRASDEGRPKATVLAERLVELNPDVSVVPVIGSVDSVLGLGVLKRMNLIFSCLDNREARVWLNRACHKVGKQWVDGAMENLLGEVTVFGVGEQPCYECTLSPADLEIMAQRVSCAGLAAAGAALGSAPTVPTMGSIVAALQVQEALNALVPAHGRSRVGYRFVLNCHSNEFYSLQLSRSRACFAHDELGKISEVTDFVSSVTTADDLLARFSSETGEDGALLFGRDLAYWACAACGAGGVVGVYRDDLLSHASPCSSCGAAAKLNVASSTQRGGRLARVPLARLGVPALDVLTVRGPTEVRLYELTGDLACSGLS